MSKIVNFDKFEPFANAAKGDESAVQDSLVHIQIQQRNGRKTLTTIQGLSTELEKTFTEIAKNSTSSVTCRSRTKVIKSKLEISRWTFDI